MKTKINFKNSKSQSISLHTKFPMVCTVDTEDLEQHYHQEMFPFSVLSAMLGMWSQPQSQEFLSLIFKGF